ncbi:MAG: protein-L-isoaspartate O-methyltransferase, partial [Gammaproteobacteria bacterium]|nr:protein-L-isoaspartate O-methyltransferase [Gammaproteobacteria bacterium]
MQHWNRLVTHALLIAGLFTGSCAHAADPFHEARLAMIDEIRATARLTSLALDMEALDPQVLQAMATVPRHALVPEAQLDAAYQNRPLPIGHGQTISQPYIVALMTDLLKPEPGDKVLEIGTGSGYQAAVLAELVEQVYSIEIIEPLGQQARRSLDGLGYKNIELRIGDGYYGWEEHAPFDAIVVTAAAGH